MGRQAKGRGGWQLRQPGGPGTTFYVRFSHRGRQHEYSTGTALPDEAKKNAAAKYAEVVTGRRAPRTVTGSFDKLVAGFLAEYEKHHASGTVDTVTMYFRAHILPFFGDVTRVTKEGAKDYARDSDHEGDAAHGAQRVERAPHVRGVGRARRRDRGTVEAWASWTPCSQRTEAAREDSGPRTG